MKKLMLIIGLSALSFSCDFLFDHSNDDANIFLTVGIGSTKKFWARNFKTGDYYQLNAKLLAQTNRCKIWAENGSGVIEETARTVALAYHNDIYPKMISTFGSNYIDGGKIRDTIEIADRYFGDNDGKLCILLLDIKDDYQKDVNNAYVAGYFWVGNFFQNDPRDSTYRYSNECDMIYVDVNPGVPGSAQSNATLAHEIQHLMNYVTSYEERSDRLTYINLMDTWIDEGLSSAAEWVYTGRHSESRWKYYNEDQSGLIKKGNNFFVWGNREDEDIYADLDDYATVYLFFQWLRLQAGSTDIYKDIITSQYSDFRAVTSAAIANIDQEYYDISDPVSWRMLLSDWLAANYINAETGRYGYRNDSTLKQIKAHYAPSGTTSLQLAPGEGVYSITSEQPTILGQGVNIKNAYLSTTITPTYLANSVMLTYNGNSDIEGYSEIGITTGIATSIAPAVFAARSITAPLKGPFPIGAGDALRRGGHKEQMFNDLPLDRSGGSLIAE